MKRSLTFLVTAPPLLVAMACGWLYSDHVIGHKPSLSNGWFDLRPLDPFFNVVQNIFFSVLFAIVTGLVLTGARAIFEKRFDEANALMYACAASSCLVVAFTAWSYTSHIRESLEREERLRKQFAVEDAAQRNWETIVKSQMDQLGWVRYPRPVIDEARGKKGFDVVVSSATFTPEDGAEAAVNYYLSRCDSWSEDPYAFRIAVSNRGVTFLVYASKKDGESDGVSLPGGPSDLPKANQGPSHWTAPSRAEAPAQEPAPVPSDSILQVPKEAVYPGASRSDENGTARLWTADPMEKVLDYYGSAGAQETGTSNAGFDHDLAVEGVSLHLSSVFTQDGTKGTLIVIKNR